MKLTVGCVNEKVENKGGDWGQKREYRIQKRESVEHFILREDD